MEFGIILFILQALLAKGDKGYKCQLFLDGVGEILLPSPFSFPNISTLVTTLAIYLSNLYSKE